MIARSFRPVGWVAAVGAAALGCYMLSLRVAAERADLDRLDARIIAASQNIRSLQTELGTRGRMQQLEQWNDEVLALSAPVSGQFVEGGVSLARFDIRQPQIAPGTDVRLASAETVTAPAVAAPALAPPPLVRQASAMLPAPAAALPEAPRPPAAQPAPTKVPPPTPARATTTQERPRLVAAPVRIASSEPPRPAAVERTRPVAPASRPRPAALLDERTMRDLVSTARSERRGGTRN